MNELFKCFLLFVFVLSSFFLVSCVAATSPSFLQEYKLVENYKEGEDSSVYVYKNKNETMRVKVVNDINRVEADDMIESSMILMESLFDATAVSYPGVLSNEIVCNEEYVPIKSHVRHKGEVLQYFVVYLTSRLTYGGCTDDLTAYKGVIGWKYCGHNQLMQMEIIYPKKEYSNNAIEKLKKNICMEFN